MKHKTILFTLAILVLISFGCQQKKNYHDKVLKAKASTVALQEIEAFQAAKNTEFKNPETSPLSDKYRKNFEGLDFFNPDSSYIVAAKFIRTTEALPFLMPTTTGEYSTEVVYGKVYFELHKKKFELELYQNKELMLKRGYENYLFLPFTDLTNDEETYGGGRYIDLSIPDSDMITIDFNRAYNPYCAYNKKYSCPIVPKVNDLQTRVLAGVKAFDKGY